MEKFLKKILNVVMKKVKENTSILSIFIVSGTTEKSSFLKLMLLSSSQDGS